MFVLQRAQNFTPGKELLTPTPLGGFCGFAFYRRYPAFFPVGGGFILWVCDLMPRPFGDLCKKSTNVMLICYISRVSAVDLAPRVTYNS
jgi:hypothetical protein